MLINLRLLLFFVALFGCWSIQLGQDMNGDLLNYHYYNGFALFHQRMSIDIAPALMQTYLNPFFDAINYVFIAIQQPRLTAFLLGAISGLIGFILYLIAKLLFEPESEINRERYVALALLIGLTGAAGVSLIGTTTNDTKMTLMVLTAVYLILKASRDHSRSYLIGAGVIAGLALGFKLTAAAYVVGLIAMVYMGSLSNSVFLFTLFSGFVMANGYWMWLLWQNFQSPLYPLYNNIFHSPYAPFYSFNMKSTAAAAHHLHFLDYAVLPLYLGWQKNTFVSGIPLRDMRMASVFVLALLLMIKKLTQRVQALPNSDGWSLLMTFFMVSYIMWLIMLQNYRYILPLEILSGLLCVYFINNLIKPAWRSQLFLLLISVIFSVTTIYPNWGRVVFAERYFMLAVPDLPKRSTILLKSVPLAFVAPSFPAETAFFGMPYIQLDVDENHYQAAPPLLFRNSLKKIKTELVNHAVYTLAFSQIDSNNLRTTKILRLYGLVEDTAHCQTFATSGSGELKLCPLHHD